MSAAPASPSIAFLAAETEVARSARDALAGRYGEVPPRDAAAIVALGGDGFMLETLHRFRDAQAPIYGMNRGSVGFLMNTYAEENLPERLRDAVAVRLTPLVMSAETMDGRAVEALAFNEVSLLRQTRLAAKLAIDVDGKRRMEELICDGALVSTAAGSTAYNLSAHGPILPMGSALLALTPICAFRPRRWRGAILPAKAVVTLTVLESGHRPVSATADFTEVRDVRKVTISQDAGVGATILFDPEHNLEERILREQFTP